MFTRSTTTSLNAACSPKTLVSRFSNSSVQLKDPTTGGPVGLEQILSSVSKVAKGGSMVARHVLREVGGGVKRGVSAYTMSQPMKRTERKDEHNAGSTMDNVLEDLPVALHPLKQTVSQLGDLVDQAAKAPEYLVSQLKSGQKPHEIIDFVHGEVSTGLSSSQSSKSLYPGHVPSSPIEKMGLAVAAATLGFVDPLKADMVAMLGEATGGPALHQMKLRMESNEVGRQILLEKPEIDEQTLNPKEMLQYPEGTLGREYGEFMTGYGYSPDERSPVMLVDDVETAYVMKRFRQIHDFYHVLAGQPTNVFGELVVKWAEFFQTGLPVSLLSATVGPLRLSVGQQIQLWTQALPWAMYTARTSTNMMNVYYEKHLETSVDDLRNEMNVVPFERWNNAGESQTIQTNQQTNNNGTNE
eukprot:TRINITY_DN479_c0_g1_i2.p1 TRINITY_DN479_c0_g1~~TRINITY_DN479_c0_g1_i2.p1  ORF type:complete len:420 (-),score=105.97 TRINITY_DN479_c0_g1_i2:688-1926(-)